MIHAILLDLYQVEVGDDEYAVTFSGELDDCKAQSNHDGRYQTWEKADFHESGSVPTQLEGPTGGLDEGRIVSLEEQASFLPAALRKMGLRVAVGVAAGLVAALAVARAARSRGSKK